MLALIYTFFEVISDSLGEDGYICINISFDLIVQSLLFLISLLFKLFSHVSQLIGEKFAFVVQVKHAIWIDKR